MKFYTNTNKRGDIFKLSIEKYAVNETICIASAFFSCSDFIKKAIENECEVDLIVRLSSATSGERLKDIFNMKGVRIRFFTDRKFHPKLYIFGNTIAFLGSSNLTNSGITSNQEVNVAIEEEIDITNLQKIFAEYWDEAEPLTENILNEFLIIENFINEDESIIENKYEKELKNKIGEFKFNSDVNINKNKKIKSSIFASAFKKKYQLFLDKYKFLEEIYTELTLNKRKADDLPIQMEIDQFLSWIRDDYANGDTYKDVKELDKDTIKNKILKYINEFLVCTTYIKNEYIDNYNFVKSKLSSEENINKMSEYDISKCLLFINAFKSRTRYQHGDKKMLELFFEKNDIQKIKDVVNYLLYGSGDYQDRIANCIYEDNYSLFQFGESCLKELFGLMNNKNIPPCNDRTLKVMQWLGFGKLI